MKIECGECGAVYREDTNLLTGKPVWLPPRKRRGVKCAHPLSSAQPVGAAPVDPEVPQP